MRAAKEEKLLHVRDLNSGFSGAKDNADLGFAYFQSYLVVDYITEEYGFSKLRELIDQYAIVKDESERFNEVFQLSLEEFNTGFQRWIDQRVEEINVYVHSEDVPDEGRGMGMGFAKTQAPYWPSYTTTRP